MKLKCGLKVYGESVLVIWAFILKLIVVCGEFDEKADQIDTTQTKQRTAQVTVSDGILEGELTPSDYGSEYYSFKGIPYAEPPVGDLRFKAPQPIKPWEGVRQAKSFGPYCFQFNLVSPPPVGPSVGNEDCLYLNVYTPELNPLELLPVMFWIYGGAFVLGEGNNESYGPDYLIRHGVIVVTFNYRLGPLGFLSLNTEDIPGNAAMKDQVAALRWVKNNIRNFGGDQNNITIFGESAGAVSVSYHLVSPMTKGLFRRAIAQSGALTCAWAQIEEPREKALKLAKHLGFHSVDDEEVTRFLKSLPAGVLNIDAAKHLDVIYSKRPYALHYSVVEEKQFGDNERFFYGNVNELLKNGIHEGVDVIMGYNQDEGMMGLSTGTRLEALVDEANGFKEFFVPEPIQRNNLINVQLEVGRKVKEFYFGRYIIKTEDTEKLFRYISWDMFLQGITIMAELISSRNNVYFYKFTAYTDVNLQNSFYPELQTILSGKEMVSHGDDLLYLFSPRKVNLDDNQRAEYHQIVNNFSTLWTNFAKFGHPTPDHSLGVQWTPFTLQNRNYLEIGKTLVAGTSPDHEDQVFWDSIYREYLPSWKAD